MMKYVFMIFMLFIMMKWNKLVMFYYNMCFILSIMMLFNYSFKNNLNMNLSMFMSMDYYSYLLIILNFWVMGLMFMGLMSIEETLKKMMFLMMMIILMMFFLMSNIMLFYLFFEMSMIPTFMLIIYWGYNLERMSAAYYMLMYMLFISLPFLIYMMNLYIKLGSLSFYIILTMKMKELSLWSFLTIMGMFYIKMPIFFFHIWLPKAHVEAPVYGSMILAAILLKLGSYGLLRFLMFFLKSSLKFNNLIISIGIIGSLLVSFICLVQIDMKSMVAYSSVVHMNLMLCGLMSMYKLGFISSYIIMISHGLCSSGLFYMVNLFYYRTSSRLLMMNKGLINLMSSFTLWWFMLCSSNFSFPLSFGFIGEIYILGVLISWSSILMMYLIVISFFSSAYSLYLFSYVQHGEILNLNHYNSGNFKEMLILIMHMFPLMMMLVNMIMF
uniref:NADH-ubiquinone oxidoreductase chain 4 n=1 Tax=Cryptopone sauteri TaxID=255801 RepID=A0A411HSF8_9HYME|nr:NADH dehydrogenase subunit 4 [Cryptopone sauteri]QBB73601.1 NADH dehydrogenase subunit 4 [Cryptopone sauteri]